MKNRRLFIISAIVLLLAAGAGLVAVSAAGRRSTAVAATRGTAVEIVYATGGVEPVRWAKVASLIRDRIVDICDCEGKTVDKGDVLARLDDHEAQAQLKELQAREDFPKREMSRVSELIARGSATTQAFERASMDLQQVQALIAVQIEKINDYTIVAPMDGVVLRRDGEIGEIAEAGQILFRVGVPKPLQVVAEVNEEDIPRVARRPDRAVPHRRLSRPAARRQGPRDHADGRRRRQDLRIKMALPDDTPLKPGMSVEANIVTREKPNALLVPADAVQGNAVFVDRRTTARASARSRSASAAPAQVEVAVGPEGGRARRLAGARPISRTATACASSPPRHERRAMNLISRHRLDPCARARAPDRLRGRRRRHRRRLLDHDGVADGRLAGRFHPAPGQRAAAHHRVRRAARTAAAAGAAVMFAAAEIHGLTPEARRRGIKNPLATMAALEAWLPGAVAPSVKVQAIIRYASHDVATSVIGIDPRREAQVSDLPKQMRGATLTALYRATNAIILGDRLAEKIGARIGANITVQTSEGARINAQVVGFFHSGVRQVDESTAYVLVKTGQILAQQTGLINELRVRRERSDGRARGRRAHRARHRLQIGVLAGGARGPALDLRHPQHHHVHGGRRHPAGGELRHLQHHLHHHA